MTPMEMLHAAIRLGLTEESTDPGQNAGEHFMTLAHKRGLEVADATNIYRCAVNHAAVADIAVTATLKGETWATPPISSTWNPACLMDKSGTHLRRFLAVSSWNDERVFYEKNSWFGLGEVANLQLPMQMVVCVIGTMSGGRRHGHWSKALLHPQHSHLRFKLKRSSTIEGFKETWLPIYREDHDEIGRDRWLQGMYDDGVLQDSLFVVNIPIPPEPECVRIQDLAKRQFERLNHLQEIPDPHLSTCHDPIHPCPFRVCCWGQPKESPSEKTGFDRISSAVPIPSSP